MEPVVKAAIVGPELTAERPRLIQVAPEKVPHLILMAEGPVDLWALAMAGPVEAEALLGAMVDRVVPVVV